MGRTFATANVLDFIPLHWEFIERGEVRAGIVLVAQWRSTVGELVLALANVGTNRSVNEIRNNLEFLSDWRPQ